MSEYGFFLTQIFPLKVKSTILSLYRKIMSEKPIFRFILCSGSVSDSDFLFYLLSKSKHFQLIFFQNLSLYTDRIKSKIHFKKMRHFFAAHFYDLRCIFSKKSDMLMQTQIVSSENGRVLGIKTFLLDQKLTKKFWKMLLVSHIINMFHLINTFCDMRFCVKY